MADSQANSFHDIKKRILEANDLELHFVALVVFNELATRRLGPDSLVLDASGCAIIAKKPVVRAKTPRRTKAVVLAETTEGPAAATQADVDAMYHLNIGEDLELGPDDYDEVVAGASVSPDPPSDPRPVPERKEKKVPIPKPKGAMRS